MMYSKSNLLKMILDNDQKTQASKTIGPVVNVPEAIHGANKTNFEASKEKGGKLGLPLGHINDSE